VVGEVRVPWYPPPPDPSSTEEGSHYGAKRICSGARIMISGLP
jgi:hypothetical protein